MTQKKIFNVRLDRDLWSFLKKKGVDRELSLNEMIIDLIEKYKKKCEKKLTSTNTMV